MFLKMTYTISVFLIDFLKSSCLIYRYIYIAIDTINTLHTTHENNAFKINSYINNTLKFKKILLLNTRYGDLNISFKCNSLIVSVVLLY